MNAPSGVSLADIAQAQLDAYNAQDLDGYCSFFTDDLIVSNMNGAVSIQGGEAFRAKYAQVFAEFPENKVELLARIVVGNTVIDHEKVVRRPGGESFEVAAIYTFAGGRIARVDFAK
ncbi:MAG: nuclear transport factor 2 family protein [Phenylobacterium sp.]